VKFLKTTFRAVKLVHLKKKTWLLRIYQKLTKHIFKDKLPNAN